MAGTKRRFGPPSTEDSYLDDLRRHPGRRLSREEERELAQRIQAGDEAARNALVEAHLRFVVWVARGYQNRGLTLAELISAGNTGLMKAAERFEGTRDARFTSYAWWWIQGAIKEARPLRSLDEPLGGGDDDERTLLDTLPDESAPAPDEAAEISSARSQLAKSLAALTAQERAVLCASFGLDGKEPRTLERIAEELGMTRSQVCQVQEHAISCLITSDDHVGILAALCGMHGRSFGLPELLELREREMRIRGIRERRRGAIVRAVAADCQRRRLRPPRPDEIVRATNGWLTQEEAVRCLQDLSRSAGV